MVRFFTMLLAGMTILGLSANDELIDQTLQYAKGHQDFKTLYFKQHEQEFVRLVEEGQSPQTLFIGCSDSRVVPSLITNTRPGDLFVIRTAGNFVPPLNETCADGVAASLQYAVEVLGVKHIIVCGHSHCGAIKGLYERPDPVKLSLVDKWLQYGEPAKKMTMVAVKGKVTKEELYEATEKLSVVFQLENLLTYPFIKKRVDNNQIELHGWYFTIETGEIEYYDPELYDFKTLTSKLVVN